jgi:hypothetical protein
MPLHSPLHPAKEYPGAGVCWKLTMVPTAYSGVKHVPMPSMQFSRPGGAEVTVPAPMRTCTSSGTLLPVKVASTEFPAPIVNTQVVLVPLHGLIGRGKSQFRKVEALANWDAPSGTAVSVITVFAANVPMQEAPGGA